MASSRSIIAGLAVLASAAFASLGGLNARAADVADLYETLQPVTSTREAAFTDALRTVVVRVSGQRDAPARLGAQLADPQRYVQRYGFAAQNVLEVGFDSVSIDRMLLDAGLPVWGRERPATLVVLGVQEPDGSQHWSSVDAPAFDREQMERAARERGLPLVWDMLNAQDRAQLDAGSAPLQLAQRHGANAVMIGRAHAGSVRWMLASADGVQQFAGAPPDAVHMAADAFARVFAAAGSTLDSVVVEVSGLTDLDAYAQTLNYLEGVTLVRSVALEQVAGDTMRFRLTVRGDAATLRRAIALGNRLAALAPADGSAPSDRLAFRYQR